MEIKGIFTIFIVILNLLISIKGFSNLYFFISRRLETDAIIGRKEYYRLISSGFLHSSWIHLLVNMFALFWLGKVLEPIWGPLKVIVIYCLGIFGGNLLTLILNRKNEYFSTTGSAGGICALIMAGIGLFPDFYLTGYFSFLTLPGWGFGLAFILFSIYLFKSPKQKIQSEICLGGSITGLLATVLLITDFVLVQYLVMFLVIIPIIAFVYTFFDRENTEEEYLAFNRPDLTESIEDKYNTWKKRNQMELDRILDKINKNGLDSLTFQERKTLDQFSSKEN